MLKNKLFFFFVCICVVPLAVAQSTLEYSEKASGIDNNHDPHQSTDMMVNTTEDMTATTMEVKYNDTEGNSNGL